MTNLTRRLVLPLAIQPWSLTRLQPRLFKGRQAQYFILRLAESHLTQCLFRQILGPVEGLGGQLMSGRTQGGRA